MSIKAARMSYGFTLNAIVDDLGIRYDRINEVIIKAAASRK